MELKDILKGKRISILGDSISTFEGVSNDGNANPTIAKNKVYYGNKIPFHLSDTWWMRLINKYGMKLCVNNSWSGGLLYNHLPEYEEDISSGELRAHELADKDGNLPDIIIVYMGINDLGHDIGAEEFGGAYNSVLDTISEKYPKAEVFCVSLVVRYDFQAYLAKQLDTAMRKAIAAHGDKVHYVDLFNSVFNYDYYIANSFDELHPSASGMRIIADMIEDALKIFEKNN